PGVTDNVASTARESMEDLLGASFSGEEGVFTSRLLLLSGDLDRGVVEQVSKRLANPLIQRTTIRQRKDWERPAVRAITVPVVQLAAQTAVVTVDLALPDSELADLGSYGIMDPGGQRRGPLALDLAAMKAIQSYFKAAKRPPTDIELEAIAQTWSEHCKHTIFADPLDDITTGIFKAHIKAATEKVRQLKGDADNCVSVFTDNSGAIRFDDDYLITHKVETHNSPSALDPFGGAITGIVGVNRDTIGFGLGAKPVANTYGFCLADPADETPLYRDKAATAPMLAPRRIMEGVIEGVNVGGNCSGIPTPQGFTYFDPSYKGKPLVFVGTLGLIPAKLGKRLSHEKAARPGNLVVMVGGRVGLDGIHGATFSSVEMDAHSPATAVQIGDPITQKKFSDALVKEARDRNLYTSITDNGAGGLSCSVAEMAKESGGFEVDLETVPLKYPKLAPWQIWISESQERMTLAIDPAKWEEFAELMGHRGVEATVIGRFTDSGRCLVRYHGDTVLDLDMEFLHEGLPKLRRTTKWSKPPSRPAIIQAKDWSQLATRLVGRLNLASNEFISQQYDHEVQASSVLKPLQGRGRVNAEASVVAPVWGSKRGVALSQSLYPSYSDLDPYAMAAAAIDTAVRNLVAVGADPDTIALLDNFCWCSSDDPFRLGQLKQATQACYDYAVAYRAPFISGKDSMFNDFKGFDGGGKPVQISSAPTLLISSVGIVPDVTKGVSLDPKAAGDLVYLLGATNDELGGSELHDLLGVDRLSGKVPQVNATTNLKLYRRLAEATSRGLVASSLSLTRGGLLAGLTKMAMGGKLGMAIDLDMIVAQARSLAAALGSESQGRVLVTVAPENQGAFEELMMPGGNVVTWIGKITDQTNLTVRNRGVVELSVGIKDLLASYRKTFGGF
ncbi:MAG TPA: AIR synthase-related protein, partial [Candidatus Saccharimonadales bacterium]|nr:AIR synthase-related protein [Candidatus Saccharimonadales bacterium]